MVYSAEKSRRNEPREDRITAQEVSVIRVGMIKQFRKELRERAHDSPLSREEGDLVNELCEIDNCLAEVRTWYSKVGLDTTLTDKELQARLASLLKGPEHELAYQLLDKVLEYTERTPVMLRGIMLQQLAEWYKQPVVILIPSRDSKSGVVSVVGMTFRPKQEQLCAVPLALAIVPLNGTINLELTLNDASFQQKLDHFCPLARVEDLGAGVARATLEEEVAAQLDRLPLLEGGEAGSGSDNKVPQDIEILLARGKSLEAHDLLCTSPGLVMEATLLVNDCDAAIANCTNAKGSLQVQKIRHNTLTWATSRLNRLEKSQGLPPPPDENDMLSEGEQPLEKARRIATLLTRLVPEVLEGPDITLQEMNQLTSLASILIEIDEGSTKLSLEQQAELDEITGEVLARVTWLQKEFGKALRLARENVESAEAAEGFTLVAHGKAPTADEAKLLKRANELGLQSQQILTQGRALSGQREREMRGALQLPYHAHASKKNPPGSYANKTHAASASLGPKSKASTPPRNGK